MNLTALYALRAEPPVSPDADEARRWAQDELAKQVYEDAKPGWAEQIGSLIMRALGELLDRVGVAPAHTGLAIVGTLVAVAALVIVLVLRPRLNRKRQATEAVFAESMALSSAEHRKRADAAAAMGDYFTAVTEQFRALVRAAEERGVNTPAPGRTAVEIASELERAFPDHAARLHRSAELFNAARYGQNPPTVGMFEELRSVDADLAAATPVYSQSFDAVLP